MIVENIDSLPEKKKGIKESLGWDNIFENIESEESIRFEDIMNFKEYTNMPLLADIDI